MINKIIDFEKKINELNKEQEIIDYKNLFFKSNITPLYAELKKVDESKRKELGQEINNYKIRVDDVFSKRLAEVIEINQNKNHVVDYDISLNTTDLTKGSLHPVSYIYKRMLEWFKLHNFSIESGEEVMDIKYNFDHLNLNEMHPTREPSETFYLKDKQYTLRSQNTAHSAFVMHNNTDEEIRYAIPGWVYRNDEDDVSHSHQFHQLDFIWVKNGLNVRNLKWLVSSFCKYVFSKDTEVRFTMSNYSFTEPSFEAQATCPFCNGNGCGACKKTGWITVGGLGIFHERVMNASNITDKTGIAGGFGIDRIAMIKYGISDVRELFKGDFRLLTKLSNQGGNR